MRKERTAALLLTILGTVISVARATEGGPSDGGGEWVEESAEALEDLSASGHPPTGDERAMFLGTEEQGPGRPWGFLGLRWGWQQERGDDLTVRLNLDPGPWLVKARGKRNAEGQVERAGAAGYDSGALAVRVGHLGFNHGYGLLSAAPGRSSSLSADQGLRMGRTRDVTWTGSPDDRTYLGGAARLSRGAWHLRGMVGAENQGGPSQRVPTVVGHLRHSGRAGGFGVAVVSRPTGRALGMTGRMSRGPLQGDTEVCSWRPSGDGTVRWAMVGTVRWTPVRRAFLETGLAAADGKEGWGPGRRPALLPGWTGRGYVLRAGLRTTDGLKLRALIHQGLAEAEDEGGDRNRRRLLDLQAGRDLSREWETFIRIRRTSWTRWERPVRHPWLPATATTTRLRTVVSLSLIHERGPWRHTLLVRTLGQETPGSAGRRTILSHAVRGRPWGGWTVRFFLASAWGDDVDLVTAVVPLSGLVLARHWGRWRSESGVGLGWTHRGLKLQVAGGYRRAEPGRGERDRTWGQVSFEGRW